MSQTFFHYINGKWKEGNGKTFHSRDPSTGELIGVGQESDQSQVDEAFDAAKTALKTWSMTSLSERISYIQEYEEILNENKQEVARAISEETGKPLWEAHTELSAMINKISVSIEAYHDRTGEIKKQDGKRHIHLFHKPLGILGVIVPFNFPGHLMHGQIIPALIAGNTLVIKPSEHTPIVGEELIRLWQKIDLPEGVINLIQGAKDAGKMLAEHPDLSGLVFTGSYETGLKLSQYFGNHPEKVLALEMGGNNPLIISKNINPKAAALLTIQSAFITSGQRCTCARRLILIKGKNSDEYLKELTQYMQKIKIGSYLDAPEPFMGPLISPDAALKAMQWQKDLLSEGATPIIEMKLQKPSTVTPGLIDVTDMKNRKDEELFGPCLHLIYKDNLTDAINEANNTRYGLSAGLISEDSEDYDQFSRDIKAGAISWNTSTTGASSKTPFGGVGRSGNHRPSALYAADYCAYPVAAIESARLSTPSYIPGVTS